MDKYIYKGAPEARAFGPIPEGDYDYVVAECGKPYFKNDKWICAVKLIIQPSGLYVFANPWSGVTAGGDERDGIAEFLLSCNRAPAPGKEPDWRAVTGARGRCHLKLEVSQAGAFEGKEVNKVAYFHVPKQLSEPPRAKDLETMRKTQERKSGGPLSPDLTREPDDIPF